MQASGTKSSRIEMLLCCRWWNSCRMSFGSSSRVGRWVPSKFAPLPSRLSTCPISHRTGLSSAWLTFCVTRRRRNSWLKCLRSYRILRTGMCSKTTTFQFLIVVLLGEEVFKISVLDRIQQRLVEQIMLKFQLRVLEVFKVSSRDRLPLLHQRTRLVLRMRLLQGFFRTFPQKKKKSAGLGPHSGSELAADFIYSMDAGSSWRAHGGRGGRV